MSEIFDEDTGKIRNRSLSNAQVLAFIAGYWRRRRAGFVLTIGLTLIAIGFEMVVPRAAQRLIDALIPGKAGAAVVWRAWGCSSASMSPSA